MYLLHVVSRQTSKRANDDDKIRAKYENSENMEYWELRNWASDVLLAFFRHFCEQFLQMEGELFWYFATNFQAKWIFELAAQCQNVTYLNVWPASIFQTW